MLGAYLPPLQHWIDNSILLNLHNAVITTQPLLLQLKQPHHIQRQLTQLLHPQLHSLQLPQILLVHKKVATILHHRPTTTINQQRHKQP